MATEAAAFAAFHARKRLLEFCVDPALLHDMLLVSGRQLRADGTDRRDDVRGLAAGTRLDQGAPDQRPCALGDLQEISRARGRRRRHPPRQHEMADRAQVLRDGEGPNDRVGPCDTETSGSVHVASWRWTLARRCGCDDATPGSYLKVSIT